MANQARGFLGYPAPNEPQESFLGEAPRSSARSGEGFMKVYTYSSDGGKEEVSQTESRCHDGTCVQRTQTFSPAFKQQPAASTEKLQEAKQEELDTVSKAGPGTRLEAMRA